MSYPTNPAILLPLLFENHPLLSTHLIPSLPPNTTYKPTTLVPTSITIIQSWPLPLRASFLHSHPRIGAPVQHLSAASKGEQTRGEGGEACPPEVVETLKVLNARYEDLFPGLRYITFVNSRSRSAIASELESRIKEWEAELREEGKGKERFEVESERWKGEVERAVREVGLIAESRAKKLESEDRIS
ncbi:hypothetical protein BT69DRAFT_1352834 [Atractiella rhizophila]|nr:hypothetical protein BT69DRAFT_1352834 [Atractiella rhizophila]